jgi:hypothetical protein
MVVHAGLAEATVARAFGKFGLSVLDPFYKLPQKS